MPRAPRTPRSASSSTASPTRSATDIGSTRSASRNCSFPRCRRPFNSVRPPAASARDGDARSGGSVAWTRARNAPSERILRSKATNASASRGWVPVRSSDRRPDRVAPQREAGPVGGRGEGRHLRLDGAEAVRAEPEVTDDVVTKTSDAVGRNRRPHTGRDLLGGQRAARPASPLENQRPEPRLRQVRRPRPGRCGRPRLRPRRIAPGPPSGGLLGGGARAATWSAARRPDAPMIPPPGCVAEPHIQRFRSGVR